MFRNIALTCFDVNPQEVYRGSERGSDQSSVIKFQVIREQDRRDRLVGIMSNINFSLSNEILSLPTNAVSIPLHQNRERIGDLPPP